MSIKPLPVKKPLSRQEVIDALQTALARAYEFPIEHVDISLHIGEPGNTTYYTIRSD